MRMRGPSLIMVALVLCASVACKPNVTPRETVTVSLQATVDALGALQDGERALFTAGKITVEQHRAFGARMVKAWTVVDDARSAALKWRGGDPMPLAISAMSTDLKQLAVDVGALLPVSPETQRLIGQVSSAVIDVLIVIGGTR